MTNVSFLDGFSPRAQHESSFYGQQRPFTSIRALISIVNHSNPTVNGNPMMEYVKHVVKIFLKTYLLFLIGLTRPENPNPGLKLPDFKVYEYLSKL